VNKDSLENYVKEVFSLIKNDAKKAKLESENSKEGDVEYNSGYLMAYHMVISRMKSQIWVFGLDQTELGLDDIDPERDLL
jgi:hypothetical protein